MLQSRRLRGLHSTSERQSSCNLSPSGDSARGWNRQHDRSNRREGTSSDPTCFHICRCGAYDGIFRAVQKACSGLYEHESEFERRQDAYEKVTGKAVYSVDFRHDGQLEGRIIYSRIAHARLTFIDYSGVESHPGIRAVTEMFPHNRLIRYEGQPLLAIAGESEECVTAASKRLVMEFEPLEAAVTMEHAKNRNSPSVYSSFWNQFTAPNASEGPLLPSLWRGNLRGPFRFFSKHRHRAIQAIEDARTSKGSDLVEGTWRTQVQCHTCLEPHACVAKWDSSDLLTVHLSTQAVTQTAHDIARRWNLRRENVRVLALNVGGGFGSKSQLSFEAVAAIELSKKAGAPVGVILDRREELISGGNRPATELDIALATDSLGNLAGVRVRSLSNAGVAIGNATTPLARLMYPNAPKDLEDWDVTTNTPPATPFRGPGGPPAFWALEQAVDEMAIRRREDPIALRRSWDSNAARQRLYDWADSIEVWKHRNELTCRTGRYRRGVGVATATWFYFINPSTQVRVSTASGGIQVFTASQDMGNGTRTVLAKIVGNVFGIPPIQVQVSIGDSNFPASATSNGSRTTASIVPATKQAAVAVRNELVLRAGSQLGLRDIEAVQGGINHRNGFASWEALIQDLLPISRIGRRKRDSGGYFLPIAIDGVAIGRYVSSSLQVTELEVDVSLGKTRVTRVWTGIAAGKIIVPQQARSQVEGAVIQGVSYALYEERRVDPRLGVMLTGSLDDYHIAGIGDVPEITVHFIEDGFEHARAHGVGIGELGTLPSAGSIGNAVRHATNWRPYELPIRPDRVLAGMNLK